MFHRAVREGASKARYDAAEVAAWSPEAPAGARLGGASFRMPIPWLRSEDGAPGRLHVRSDANGYLDLAFVLPEAMGRGVADALYAVLGGPGAGGGTFAHLTTEASLLAEPFLRAARLDASWRGRKSSVHGVTLKNARMEKRLAVRRRREAGADPPASSRRRGLGRRVPGLPEQGADWLKAMWCGTGWNRPMLPGEFLARRLQCGDPRRRDRAACQRRSRRPATRSRLEPRPRSWGSCPRSSGATCRFMGCCAGIGILAHFLGAEVSKARYGEPVGAVARTGDRGGAETIRCSTDCRRHVRCAGRPQGGGAGPARRARST